MLHSVGWQVLLCADWWHNDIVFTMVAHFHYCWGNYVRIGITSSSFADCRDANDTTHGMNLFRSSHIALSQVTMVTSANWTLKGCQQLLATLSHPQQSIGLIWPYQPHWDSHPLIRLADDGLRHSSVALTARLCA